MCGQLRTIRTNMDFAYTTEQLELRARAAALAADIMVHEEACEAANGLPPDVHARGRRARPPPRAERDQHARRVGRRRAERARPGDRPGAARPAHERAVGHGLAARQRAARLQRGAARALPAARHPRRAARLRSGHRARRRLRPDRDRHDREARRRRLRHRRREVVRHRRRRRRLPDRAGRRCPSARRRCSSSTRTRRASRSCAAALHAHVRLRAPRVRLRGRPGGRGAVLGGVGQGYELSATGSSRSG